MEKEEPVKETIDEKEKEIRRREENECLAVNSILKGSIARIISFNRKNQNKDNIRFLNEEEEKLFCEIYKECYNYIINSIRSKNTDIFNYNREDNLFSILIKSNNVDEGEKKLFFLKVPDNKTFMETRFFKKLIIDSILYFVIKFNFSKSRAIWMTDAYDESILVVEPVFKRRYVFLMPFMANYFLSIPGMAKKLNDLAVFVDTNSGLTTTGEKGGTIRNKKRVKKTLKKNYKKKKYRNKHRNFYKNKSKRKYK